MGAALLTGQKFRAICAFPVENACPLPVGRQEGPPAGARFPAWAVGTPLVSCADSSLGAGALPRRIWNPPLRPLRQPDGCHLSRRGEASCYRRRGPGLCLPALPCFRRTSRRGVRGNMRYFLLRFPGDFWYFWRSKVPHRCRTRRRQRRRLPFAFLQKPHMSS